MRTPAQVRFHVGCICNRVLNMQVGSLYRTATRLNYSALRASTLIFARFNSTYEVVVAGGGSGGISVGCRLSNKLGAGNVAIIEPADTHYYQPLWTLVGGGAKSFSQSAKPMKDVIPPKATWIKNEVKEIDPDTNSVTLGNGEKVFYKYLVVALGIKLKFEDIKGLPEAFSTPGVCSNYSPTTVDKTFSALQDFKEGNAIFTFPKPPLKCPGAPQKIMYITDSYFRKHGKRQKANIMFNSSGQAIFAVKKYAEALTKVVAEKDINVNYGLNLIEVKPDTKEAIFEKMSSPGETVSYKYEMLHVSPPCGPLDVVKSSKIVDANGFVDVNKETMQHVKYPNIFSLGDCSNVPTSKTAAAIACQNAILSKNLLAVRSGGKAVPSYEGYTSCPLVTGYNSCILAEFDFDLQPLETFPINQGKPRWSMYYMKADIMRIIYWQMLLKGRWSGPKFFRKLFHFGMSR